MERIWDLVTNVDDWPRWNKGGAERRLVGPVIEGATFDWKSGGMGIRSTFREINPLRRLTWAGRTLGTRAVHSWTFEVGEKVSL